MTYSERIQMIVDDEATELRRACDLWLAFFETDFGIEPTEQIQRSNDALKAMKELAAKDRISKHTMRRGKAIVAAVMLP